MQAGYEIVCSEMAKWLNVEELAEGDYVLCFDCKYGWENRYMTNFCIVHNTMRSHTLDWDFIDENVEWKIRWVAELYDLAHIAEINMNDEVKNYFKAKINEYTNEENNYDN